MTVNIDYEADKKLDFDYEKIIREVINGALDFEECPYETEVNVVLTTNDEIAQRLQRSVQTDRCVVISYD